MKYQFSVCNKLSIHPFISKYKPELYPQKCFGDAGHDPRTSRMLSERSTIWDTFPYSSSFEVVCEQNSWIISFSICNELSIPSHYHQIKNSRRILKNDLEMRRTSRMQSERCTIWATSPYLSHAKRALYHLSYIPVKTSPRASFWTQFMKNWLFDLQRVVNSFPLSVNINQNYRILKNVFEMLGIDPRTSRMLSERSTIWGTSPYSSSFELALNKIHEISVFHL